MNESPLFVKTFDLLLWLLPQAQKFPRAYRFNLAERIQRLCLDFQGSLVAAGKSKSDERRARLHQADIQLEQLRSLIRLAHELKIVTLSQYEHVSHMLVEIGRMLGAWIKQM